MDGWMDGFRFYVLFNSIPVISGRLREIDKERLCAMKPRIRLRKFRLDRGLKSGTAGSVGQRLTNIDIWASQIYDEIKIERKSLTFITVYIHHTVLTVNEILI